MNLGGSVAIVTGASDGIGRELALTLAGRGARLVVTARHRERLDELATMVEAGGTEVVVVSGDVASPDTAVARAALWLLDQPGHVHVGELVVGHGHNPWAG